MLGESPPQFCTSVLGGEFGEPAADPVTVLVGPAWRLFLERLPVLPACVGVPDLGGVDREWKPPPIHRGGVPLPDRSADHCLEPAEVLGAQVVLKREHR